MCSILDENMGTLIVIEGLDGFGKTYVAEKLANRIGAKYIKANTEPFKKLSAEEKMKMHPMRRLLYYLTAYGDVSETVRLSPPDALFVTDRYATSMLVYNGKLIGRDITNIVKEFQYIEPELQIHLVGDENIRRNRVETRLQTQSDWDKMIQNTPDLMYELKDRYYIFCRPSHIILNTGRDVEEILKELMSYVNKEFIDLHTHSSVVDGEISPQDLIKKASELGLKAISLTDHNTIEGIIDARAASTKYGIEFISGIELSAKEDGISLHILGYLFDEKNLKFSEYIHDMANMRRKSLEEKCQALQELGFKISLVDVLLKSPQRFVGKKNLMYHILMEPGNKPLVERYIENANDIGEAISTLKQKIFEEKEAPLVSYKTPTFRTAEAIDMIHMAGGLAFVAHPFQTFGDVDLQPYISYFHKKGCDGIEVINSSISNKQIATLMIYAQSIGLLFGGGSNFHKDWNKKYSDKGSIHIGSGINNNIRIPYHFLEKMKEKLG